MHVYTCGTQSSYSYVAIDCCPVVTYRDTFTCTQQDARGSRAEQSNREDEQ